MIEKITIENYKSIQKLEIELGRITILIGANGSGKSNILEAIAFSSAAANGKLDNEFLTSRGIRVTDNPEFMRSAFDKANVTKEIRLKIKTPNQTPYEVELQKQNDKPYSSWIDNGIKIHRMPKEVRNLLMPEEGSIPSDLSGGSDERNLIEYLTNPSQPGWLHSIMKESGLIKPETLDLEDFLIYSPENSSLRTFEKEGQIQPLGRNGEGLFKLLKVLSSPENQSRLAEVKDKLKLIDWFGDFDVAKNLAPHETRIQIRDKYLDKKLAYFDQKSSNEGFLFLLFYLCLFVSSDTPSFFAIDNIEASFNPKLCTQLMIELTALAEKYKKQVIFTTHNPAVLDGLNLNDANQKLYVVYRNKSGQTKVDKVKKPQPVNGKEPVKLSEAFLRGYLGGLPNNF
jgi:AAA15 family ATPase/GTPase